MRSGRKTSCKGLAAEYLRPKKDWPKLFEGALLTHVLLLLLLTCVVVVVVAFDILSTFDGSLSTVRN